MLGCETMARSWLRAEESGERRAWRCRRVRGTGALCGLADMAMVMIVVMRFGECLGVLVLPGPQSRDAQSGPASLDSHVSPLA